MTESSPVVAAIDIGSNTIKLTVARLGDDGPEIVESKSEVVRLGEGLAQTGQIRPDRLERAVAVLAELTNRAGRRGAVRIEAVATEATRAASNGQDFLNRVLDATGVEVTIISGDEEAALTALGVLAQIEPSGRVVIADIGGGSTELIETWDRAIYQSVSLPIGSGAMTDQHVVNDPPTESELNTIMGVAREGAREFFQDAVGTGGGKLVLVGGAGEYLMTVTSSRNPIPISVFNRARVLATNLRAAQMAKIANAPVARARVLPAGFAIAQAIADLADPDHVESVANGLRIGLLLRMCDATARID